MQNDSMLKVQSTVRKVVKGFHSLPCAWGRAQQHVKEKEKKVRAVWHLWARRVDRLPKLAALTFVP